MRRLKSGERIIYRDRHRGWSLLFFFFALPIGLVIVQEGVDRREPMLRSLGVGAALASVALSFISLRGHALVIARTAGVVVFRCLYFFWKQDRTFPLSEVKSVCLGSHVLDHVVYFGARSPVWSETVYRISVDIDRTKVSFHGGFSGQTGRNLALRLAGDLGVRVREESEDRYRGGSQGSRDVLDADRSRSERRGLPYPLPRREVPGRRTRR